MLSILLSTDSNFWNVYTYTCTKQFEKLVVILRFAYFSIGKLDMFVILFRYLKIHLNISV